MIIYSFTAVPKSMVFVNLGLFSASKMFKKVALAGEILLFQLKSYAEILWYVHYDLYYCQFELFLWIILLTLLPGVVVLALVKYFDRINCIYLYIWFGLTLGLTLTCFYKFSQMKSLFLFEIVCFSIKLKWVFLMSICCKKIDIRYWFKTA